MGQGVGICFGDNFKHNEIFFVLKNYNEAQNLISDSYYCIIVAFLSHNLFKITFYVNFNKYFR